MAHAGPSHIPYGVPHPEKYLESRSAAREDALRLGFPEGGFAEVAVSFGSMGKFVGANALWGDIGLTEEEKNAPPSSEPEVSEAVGHVNNIAYYPYLDHGRLEFMDWLFRSIPPQTARPLRTCGPMVIELSYRYLKMLQAPDTILVAHKVTQVKERRFFLESYIYSFDQRGRVGSGTVELALYDFGQHKTIKLPLELQSYLRDQADSVAKL